MITSQMPCVRDSILFSLMLSAVQVTFCQVTSEIPNDIENYIVGARVTEDNRLVSTSLTSNKDFELYVIENWTEMLNSLERLPEARGTTAAVIGYAAESLPGLEYLSFLEEFVRLFKDGAVNDHFLVSQLGGYDKKQYFLAVNYKHPLVKEFLDFAIDSIPESTDSNRYLKVVRSGALRDMYQANSSSLSPLPEALPGVTLAEPFESILAKINDSGNVKLKADEDHREPLLHVSANRPLFWIVGGFAIAVVVCFIIVFGLRKRRNNA